MSLKFKPYSMLKNAAASLSVLTMCISPVAQGAAKETQKQLLNRYLKETGLSSRQITVAEYWKKVRHVYPANFQKDMDKWLAKNSKVKMPAITATSFKDSAGVEQVRLTFSQDGKSFNATFTGNEETPLKINGVPFSKNELFDPKKINEIHTKLAKYDPYFKKYLNLEKEKQNRKPKKEVTILTYNQFKKLSARKQGEYLILLRLAMEASQKVIDTHYGPQVSRELQDKYEWVMKFFWGDEANAKGKQKSRASLAGQPCIVAGYLTKYGENGSCGGNASGAEDLRRQMEATGASCQKNYVPCNPLVYGFKPNGESHCIARSPRETINAATSLCNKASPLLDAKDTLNKERIIESYMKYKEKKEIDLKFDKDGKVKPEQYAQIEGYLGQIKDLIEKANVECNNPPLQDLKLDARKDQYSACESLLQRSIALDVASEEVVKTTPLPPTGPIEVVKCDEPWQEMRNGECGCRWGYENPQSTNCSKIEFYHPPEKEKEKDDSCGMVCAFFMSPITWGVGGISLALGLAYLFAKDDKKDKKDPVYVPPAPVDPGTPPLPPGPPPVEPPPPAPCPDTYSFVDGVCKPPPVIVPPPPVEPNEGGNTPGGPDGGGVR